MNTPMKCIQSRENIPGYGFWDGMMVPLIPSSSTTRDHGRGSTLERDSFLVHPGGKGNWQSIPWGWHGDGFMAWPRESKTRKRYGTNGDIYRSIFLTIYLSVCLSIYRSIFLTIYLSICLSVYLSIDLSF